MASWPLATLQRVELQLRNRQTPVLRRDVCFVPLEEKIQPYVGEDCWVDRKVQVPTCSRHPFEARLMPPPAPPPWAVLF